MQDRQSDMSEEEPVEEGKYELQEGAYFQVELRLVGCRRAWREDEKSKIEYKPVTAYASQKAAADNVRDFRGRLLECVFRKVVENLDDALCEHDLQILKKERK